MAGSCTALRRLATAVRTRVGAAARSQGGKARAVAVECATPAPALENKSVVTTSTSAPSNGSSSAQEPKHPSRFVSFEAAKAYVRRQGLQTWKEWMAWSASSARPSSIPSTPWRAYEGEYQGLHDFCGYQPSSRWKIARNLGTQRGGRCGVCNARLAQKNGMEWFFRQVSSACPELHFIAAPFMCQAGLFFRRAGGTDAAGEQLWLPLKTCIATRPHNHVGPERTPVYSFKLAQQKRDVVSRELKVLISLSDERIMFWSERHDDIFKRFAKIHGTQLVPIKNRKYLRERLLALWDAHTDQARPLLQCAAGLFVERRARLRMQLLQEAQARVYRSCDRSLEFSMHWESGSDVVLRGGIRLCHRMLKTFYNGRAQHNRIELSREIQGLCTPLSFCSGTSPHFVVVYHCNERCDDTEMLAEGNCLEHQSLLRGIWLLPRPAFAHCLLNGTNEFEASTSLPMYVPEALPHKRSTRDRQAQQLNYYYDLSTDAAQQSTITKIARAFDECQREIEAESFGRRHDGAIDEAEAAAML